MPRTLILLFLAVLFGPERAAAHPHVWIDVRSTVVLDAAGRIAGIEQEWLFDQMYSLYATEGIDAATPTGEKALRDLAAENLRNLGEYDYFTAVFSDGEALPLGAVDRVDTALRDGRYWLRFTVPVTAPADPLANAVTYRIADPSYYVEMLHLEGDVIAFRGADAGRCFAHIVPPTPSMDAVMLAQSMDRDAEVDESLGALFAETVVIECK